MSYEEEKKKLLGEFFKKEKEIIDKYEDDKIIGFDDRASGEIKEAWRITMKKAKELKQKYGTEQEAK